MAIVYDILQSMFFKMSANFSLDVSFYKKTPFYVLVACRPVCNWKLDLWAQKWADNFR